MNFSSGFEPLDFLICSVNSWSIDICKSVFNIMSINVQPNLDTGSLRIYPFGVSQ